MALTQEIREQAEAALTQYDHVRRSGLGTDTTQDMLASALRALLAVLSSVEPEWEYGTALRTPKGELWDFEPEASLEDAREQSAKCNEDADSIGPDVCVPVRRRPGRESGEWMALEDPTPSDAEPTTRESHD